MCSPHDAVDAHDQGSLERAFDGIDGAGRLATVAGAGLSAFRALRVASPILCDNHHGIPRQMIKDAARRGVNPKDIIGKKGQPNRIEVPRQMHQDAHNGGANGGMPRYNDNFRQRLDHIEEIRPLTSQDYWDIRAQLLWEYFGL